MNNDQSQHRLSVISRNRAVLLILYHRQQHYQQMILHD